jgi:hypothetical protein
MLWYMFDQNATNIEWVMMNKYSKYCTSITLSQIKVFLGFWLWISSVRCFQLIELINIDLLNAFDLCLTTVQQILNRLWWNVLKTLYTFNFVRLLTMKTSFRCFQLIDLINIGLLNAFAKGLTTIQQILNELWWYCTSSTLSQIKVFSGFWLWISSVRCFNWMSL